MSYSIVKVRFDRILLLLIFPLHSNRVYMYIGCMYMDLPSVYMYLYFDNSRSVFLKVTLY